MNKFAFFLSQLKNGCIQKASILEVKYSIQWVPLLNILYQEGYIQTYKILDNKIYIYLRYYNGKNSIRILKNFYKSSQMLFIKARHMWLFNRYNGILVLSTIHGVKTHEYCLKHNIGGKILFFVG